jgi:putative MATE family efflux protein
MKDQRIKLLRGEPVGKAVNKMALPAIIGLMSLAIYNVVDTMFVAWLGTEATGATQIIFPITMLMSSIGLAFGIGGGSAISRLLGKGDYEKTNEVATVSLFTSMVLGILFMLGGIVFLEPILKMLGATDTMMTMAKDYGFYIMLGSVFTMSNMTLNNLLRGEGSGKDSMIGQGTGSVLNMILDPIFIFVFGWGIAGAAIATTLSQIVTFSILLYKYISKQTVTRIGFQYFKPTKWIYMSILSIGIPTFIRQLLVSVSMTLYNNVAVLYGGEELIAAVGLVMKVYMIPMYIIFGMGQGLQPVVGYNFGAGNKERVEKTLKYSRKQTFIFALISGAVLFLIPETLLSIFNPEVSVMQYAVIGLRLHALVLLMLSYNNSIGVFYQSIGQGRVSLLLAVVRQGVFYIPLVYILPIFFGELGVIGVQFVADILTLTLTAIIFARFRRTNRLNQLMHIDCEEEKDA